MVERGASTLDQLKTANLKTRPAIAGAGRWYADSSLPNPALTA